MCVCVAGVDTIVQYGSAQFVMCLMSACVCAVMYVSACMCTNLRACIYVMYADEQCMYVC